MTFESLSPQKFTALKSNVLESLDLSKKGSVDAAISDLFKFINEQENYVTTSSCSGRTILISQDPKNASKSGCDWVLVSHDLVTEEEVLDKVTGDHENLTLKFEPFIMHVLCRTLQDTKNLQSAALDAGFRNSGATIGKQGKITYAIRSTLNLEVPLKIENHLMVTDEYIKHLVKVANEKMERNKVQIKRLQDSITRHLSG